MSQNWFDALLGRTNPPASPGPTSASSSPAPTSLLSPQAIKDPKWERRFRRLLRLAVQPGIQAVPPSMFLAALLNQFGPEDYYPDEQLVATAFQSDNTGGVSVVTSNPATSGLLYVIERIEAIRTATAGLVWFGWRAPPAVQPAYLNSTPMQRRDMRGTVVTPMLIGSTADTAVLGPPGLAAGGSGANVNPAILPLPVILKPGSWAEILAANSEATLVTVYGRLLPLPVDS